MFDFSVNSTPNSSNSFSFLLKSDSNLLLFFSKFGNIDSSCKRIKCLHKLDNPFLSLGYYDKNRLLFTKSFSTYLASEKVIFLSTSDYVLFLTKNT